MCFFKKVIVGLLLTGLIVGGVACKKKRYKKHGLEKVVDFGENPGNLRMYFYAPESPAVNAPLVVVLHGCTQNAKGAAKLTGWNELADEHGFYVLYPEQKTVNNAQKCFNWFRKKDNEKNKGENLSIANMTDYMITEFSLDEAKVHVTGLSAGAAMTSVLCAVYPSKFQTGAIMSGGPYKSSEKLFQAPKAMRGKISKPASEWGELVRGQNVDYLGVYPKIAIFHGEKDRIVNRKNADELVKQWTDVHGIDRIVDRVEDNFLGSDDVTKYSYEDISGNELVVHFQIEKMGHAVAVNPGSDSLQGGRKGMFGKDKDFYSTYWAAQYFNLIP